MSTHPASLGAAPLTPTPPARKSWFGRLFTKPFQLTPDGIRYVTAVNARVPKPFHYRWLLPRILHDNARAWAATSQIATLALLPLVWWYVGGWRGVAAAAMVTGLAGVWKFNRRFPVLVDASGMALALLSADLFRHHLWPLGLAVALLGGCVRETSPIMAALYAWNPLALCGLLPVAVRHFQREGPDPQGNPPWKIGEQFRICTKIHRAQPPWLFVLPWGAAVIALAHMSPQLALTLLACYAPMLVATDTVRIYQWAFPVVLLNATHAVSPRFLVFLVALTLANPYATEGG